MSALKELRCIVKQEGYLPPCSIVGLESDAEGDYLPWDTFINGVVVIVPPQPNGVSGDEIAAYFFGYWERATLADPEKELRIVIRGFAANYDPGSGIVGYANLTSGGMSEPFSFRVERFAPSVSVVGASDGAIPVDLLDKGLTFEFSKYYGMEVGDVVQVVVDESPVSLGFAAQLTLQQSDIDNGIYIKYPKEYSQTLPSKRLKYLAVMRKAGEVRYGELWRSTTLRRSIPITAALPSWMDADSVYETDPDLEMDWYLYPVVEDIGGIPACRFSSRINQPVGRGSRVTFHLFGVAAEPFAQTVLLEEDGPGFVSFVVPEPYLYFHSMLKTATVIVEDTDGTMYSSGLMTWAAPKSDKAAWGRTRPQYRHP
ncbi:MULTISPECIES: hypothetical protein [unclassified Pseudomonas]|uniref:hypothetical protein n=1 Tax=unclassified Pseudomonas TaxID=196821 RepID=UPI000D36F841|nr:MULTISPECIES: hypothetical protein [unclassified Pseudomonas]RAU43645.1 hypothetical protein DBP26_019130 [Pseudomonas sp. RIT 409]RAU54423.1 hypothetical protein DBY65_008840 [Pseudomonas sp. RIT 412]